MGLKPCKECHKEVSTSAKQCPHCGRKYPTGGFTLPAKLLLGLIALMVIAQIMRDPGRSSVDVSPSPTQRMTPEVVVSAEKLFADYHENEVAADSRYKGRVLSLTGFIAGINKDFLDKTYLTLRTSNMFMTVHAQIESSQVSRTAGLSKGDRVHLVCNGKGMVIGSPMVDDCYFQGDASPGPIEQVPRSVPGYYHQEKGR